MGVSYGHPHLIAVRQVVFRIATPETPPPRTNLIVFDVEFVPVPDCGVIPVDRLLGSPVVSEHPAK